MRSRSLRSTGSVPVLACLLLLAAACSVDDEPAPPPEEPAVAADGACATTPPVDPAPPGGRELVYTSYRPGTADLWLMRSDGTGRVPLTSGPAAELMPAWSPDGSRVAFACAETEDAQTDLYVMDADGTGRVALTATDELCEASPRWAPEGDRLYLTRGECGGAQGIWTLDLDDGATEEVVPLGGWPDVAADGRLLYDKVVGPDSWLLTTLWTADPDGGGAAELGPDGTPAAYEASWSPDGSRIAFVAPMGDVESEDVPEWNEEVFVMRSDGTAVRRLTRTPGNDHWPPAWSPDGRWLVYSADGIANRGRLVRIDVATGKSVTLTRGPGSALFADWR